jgi:4-amino-4-deoxy-L-arabinose transferase-like glycosyltransferase
MIWRLGIRAEIFPIGPIWMARNAVLGSGVTSGVLVVLGVSILLGLFPVWWGLPQYGSWDPEEILPSQVLQTWEWPEQYPPLHRYLLLVLFRAAEGAAALGWVPGDWMGFYTLAFVLGRLLSVGAVLATVYLTYRCGRELFDRRAATVAAALVSFVPVLVQRSKTIHPEPMFLAWFALSLWFYLRALRRQSLADYVLFAASAALAASWVSLGYTIYILSPLPLFAALYLRLPASRGSASRFTTTFTDHRLWWTLLTAVVLFALLNGLFVRPSDFVERNWSAFAEGGDSSAAIAAVLSRLRVTVGWPGLAAAVVGLTLAGRRSGWRSYAPLVLLAGGGFGLAAATSTAWGPLILPGSLVLTLYCGCLLTVAAPDTVAGKVFRGFVLGCLAYASLRAVVVDLTMFGDGRYAGEEWIDEEGLQRQSAGVGTAALLPRGLAVFGWEELAEGECRFLERLDADTLVVDASDARSTSFAVVAGRLVDGTLGYEVVERWRTRPWSTTLGFEDRYAGSVGLGRELLALQRSSRMCLSRERVPEALSSLRDSPDERLRSYLSTVIVEEDIPGRSVIEPLKAFAVGLRFDRWSVGTDPVGVVVENDGQSTARVRLRVGCRAPDRDLPVRVRVDDGKRGVEVDFERSGTTDVLLASVPPGGRQLLLVWSDKAWQPEGVDRRWLGVSVLEVELVPASR